ncbi:hypothetical protein GCM10022198_11450 [Klugiella xanthotipulae]
MLAFAFELKSLATELNSALAARFRPLGLTGVQAEAIIALDSLGPVTLKELATHLVAESGHPSRLVSRLVDDGLVARTVSPSDGRAVVLKLTQHGRDLAARAREARQPLVEEFAHACDSRLSEAVDLLRQLRRTLAER